MVTVEFNGKTNHDVGVNCIDPGRRQGAEEQLITYTVPNRDDEPIEHTGTYKPYLRAMIFAARDKSKLKDLFDWLQGAGKLYTSKDPGGFFKAHVVSQRYVTRHTLNYDYIQVIFKINPGFFYLGSGETPIPIGAPGSLENPGNHIAKPYIKITGSGNIDLDVNGRICSFTGLTDYIEIDSESEYCYRETSNMGDKMEGDFPYFEPGVNNISWTGSVINIEVIPRWRDK